MTPLTAAKLILGASGLCIWGLGIRNGEPVLKYLGIALLAVSVILRFVRPGAKRP